MEFPSPCGVNIVANDALINQQEYCLILFPSPCGVNIVANMGLPYWLWTRRFLVSVPLRGKYCGELDKVFGIDFLIEVEVSVPLRGKYCGEFRNAKFYRLDQLKVSVPLRGKYCGEFMSQFTNLVEATLSKFPSPCGVNIVANQGDRAWVSRVCKAMPWFPSPCGVNIVANARMLSSASYNPNQGFRPLAG